MFASGFPLPPLRIHSIKTRCWPLGNPIPPAARRCQLVSTCATRKAGRGATGTGKQIPKAALRTESTSDRPSNQLAELSRLAGCLKLHSTSKCAKWLVLRAKKRFLSRASLQAPEGRIEGAQANHIPVSDLQGGTCGLRAYVKVGYIYV